MSPPTKGDCIQINEQKYNSYGYLEEKGADYCDKVHCKTRWAPLEQYDEYPRTDCGVISCSPGLCWRQPSRMGARNLLPGLAGAPSPPPPGNSWPLLPHPTSAAPDVANTSVAEPPPSSTFAIFMFFFSFFFMLRLSSSGRGASPCLFLSINNEVSALSCCWDTKNQEQSHFLGNDSAQGPGWLAT